jgi:hypothetical protein
MSSGFACQGSHCEIPVERPLALIPDILARSDAPEAKVFVKSRCPVQRAFAYERVGDGPTRR